MGLFGNNLTEEQIMLKELKEKIAKSKLTEECKSNYNNYIDNIVKGTKINPFFDTKFLMSVIYELVDKNIGTDLEKLEEEIKRLFPAGIKTEGYEELKELFINNLVNCINGDFYNDVMSEIEVLFANKLFYYDIVNSALLEDYVATDLTYLPIYASEVARYCKDDYALKQELQSFIYGMKNNLYNMDEYFNERLDSAKKRCGEYSIDEKELAAVTSEVEEVEKQILILQDLSKKVDESKTSITQLTNEGRRTLRGATSEGLEKIEEASINAISKLKAELEQEKLNIQSNLKEFQDFLARQMKTNSDLVFGEVLKSAQKKIEELEAAATMLGSSTTSELLRIQSEASTVVSQLKAFVKDDETLKELLKEASNLEEVKQKIIYVQETAKDIGKNTTDANQVVSPVVVENNNVVIPSDSSILKQPIIYTPDKKPQVLKLFDLKVPYSEKKKYINEFISKGESKGNIYHEKLPQIMATLIAGEKVPYLYGASGAGKSYMIEQIADIIGTEVYEMDPVTSTTDIYGYRALNQEFIPSQVCSGFINGGIISFEEVDGSDPASLLPLHNYLSLLNKKIKNPNKDIYAYFCRDGSAKIPVSANARIIATANTSGTGATAIYSSRLPIDGATRERFAPICIDYDNRVEKNILKNYPNWYKFFTDYREATIKYASKQSSHEVEGPVTTRDASSLNIYLTNASKNLSSIMEEEFVQTKEPAYLQDLVDYFEDKYRINDYNLPNDILNSENKVSKLDEEKIVKAFVLTANKRIKR